MSDVGSGKQFKNPNFLNFSSFQFISGSLQKLNELRKLGNKKKKKKNLEKISTSHYSCREFRSEIKLVYGEMMQSSGKRSKRKFQSPTKKVGILGPGKRPERGEFGRTERAKAAQPALIRPRRPHCGVICALC